MPRHRSLVAVCVLRIEAEPESLIVTMTVNRDITTATAEPATRFTDSSSAAAAVAEFLESFTPDKPPR